MKLPSLRILLSMALGLTAVACGAAVGTKAPGTGASTGAAEAPATAKVEVPVDVNHPWMQWGESHADGGRGRLRVDGTGEWSAKKALEGRAPTLAGATAATREAIPKAVEPGSRIGSVPVLPEPADVIGK